jgi:hypothetical protein
VPVAAAARVAALARPMHIGPMHGPDAWVQCMGPMHGSNAWVRCMGPMHGSNAWVQCKGPKCMGPMHGSNAWVRCMAAVSARREDFSLGCARVRSGRSPTACDGSAGEIGCVSTARRRWRSACAWSSTRDLTLPAPAPRAHHPWATSSSQEHDLVSLSGRSTTSSRPPRTHASSSSRRVRCATSPTSLGPSHQPWARSHLPRALPSALGPLTPPASTPRRATWAST